MRWLTVLAALHPAEWPFGSPQIASRFHDTRNTIPFAWPDHSFPFHIVRRVYAELTQTCHICIDSAPVSPQKGTETLFPSTQIKRWKEIKVKKRVRDIGGKIQFFTPYCDPYVLRTPCRDTTHSAVLLVWPHMAVFWFFWNTSFIN